MGSLFKKVLVSSPGNNVIYRGLFHFHHPILLTSAEVKVSTSSHSLASVRTIDLCMDWAVVVTKSVYPVIGSRKSWSWNRLGLVLSPHQILQLPELVPEVGVGWWDGLGDGGVDVGDPRLGSRAEVGSAFQGRHIVTPELRLLGEGNVAGVEV